MLIPELAYIDPGSGSLIIQGAIASIVAGAVFFRAQIARLLPGRRNETRDQMPSTDPRDTRREATTSVDDAARGG